jgi:peptide-methionine (S)-S-oxide reductase
MPSYKLQMPEPGSELPGRDEPIRITAKHLVTGNPMTGPFPDHLETVVVGMGCFWGAERKFWQADGVWTTAVGYAGGATKNPTYEETCTGRTGHTEVVLVVFDPAMISLEGICKIFWENHDPTQGMRQGNDVGTQYRSCIYVSSAEQRAIVDESLAGYQRALAAAGHAAITTEVLGPPAPHFYYAEDYHQQYLYKNPNGYCGIGGTGVSCSI